MKKLCFIIIFLIFCGISIFSDNEKQEEIDFLLFMPNSGNEFVNEEQAIVQLDNLAKYLLAKNIVSGQIIVNGYAAFAPNDIEPVNLSRERAVFVINELQKRGVSKDLFSNPVGHGSVYLWGNNTEENDRKPNRRVRILLGGEYPTSITPEIVSAEIGPVISDAEQGLPVTQTPLTPTSPTGTLEKSNFKFPWWILLVLPLLLLLLLALKNKSKKTANETATSSGQKQILKTEAILEHEKEIELLAKPAPVVEFAPKPEPKPAPPPEPEKASAPKPEPASAPKHEPIVETVSIHKHEHAPAHKHETESAPAKPVEKLNLDEEIRLRAYELSERRNWHGDYREQDWYDAMREVTALYIYRGYTVFFEDGFWFAAKS